MPDISEHVQLLAESLVFSSVTEARNYLPVSVFVFVFIYRNSGEETQDFQLLFNLFNLVVALFSFTEIQVRKLEELSSRRDEISSKCLWNCSFICKKETFL